MFGVGGGGGLLRMFLIIYLLCFMGEVCEGLFVIVKMFVCVKIFLCW